MKFCKRFSSLKAAINKECKLNGIPDNTRIYFINKISRKIKRFNNDVYEVKVSMNGYHSEYGGYFSYFKVHSIDGCMHVSVRVD